MSRLRLAALACCSLLLATSAAIAEPTATLSLEGQLTNAAGTAVPDGDYNIKVSFYKDAVTPAALYSELHVVKLLSGGFGLTLGLSQPLKTEVFYDGSAVFVGVQVGTEQELPRLPINFVAYALRADQAKSVSCTGCIKAEQLDASVLAPYATKKELEPLATKKELEPLATKKDLESLATKKELEPLATKKDLEPFAKTADLKFAAADQKCELGAVFGGIDAAGKAICVTDKVNT